MIMDKSEIYEKQLSKIFQRLLVDKYPVITNVEFEIEYHGSGPNFEVGNSEYSIDMVIYYSTLLSDVPRHKRIQTIKDYLGINYYNGSIHGFIEGLIGYIIPEKFYLGLFNEVEP